MNMLPKISIVIPFYNHHDLINLTLQSILSQTYSNKEVIIVDDGSSQELNITDDELVRDLNLKIIYQDNRGASSARNVGAGISSGEFIIFWDADVLADREMLMKLYEALVHNLEASFSYCHYYFGWKSMRAREFSLSELKKYNYIHSTSLIRKDALIEWDENLKRFQDWDLWLSMGRCDLFGVLVPEHLFRIIPRRDGMSWWMPKIFYKKPFSGLPIVRERVKKYNDAKKIVLKKHNISEL